MGDAAGVAVDVWIPERTRPEHRALLPGAVVLHDLPAGGPLPERLGAGEVLVAEFAHERAADAMPRLDGLRVVLSLSAGVERLAAAVPAGVTLCDGSGIHDASVAEWVVMAVLAVRRRLPAHLAAQREGRWRRGREPAGGADLEGATVLIVGYGSIGRAVEERLLQFGVQVERVARTSRDGVRGVDALAELLPRADVVVILLPLTELTRGFVDTAFLAWMRPGALLVNAARGAVVDTDALLDALREGRVLAALDVTEPEPLPDGHPLWTAPGVLITPHIAGSVRALHDRAWHFAAEQLGRYLRGEPLRNVVVDGY